MIPEVTKSSLTPEEQAQPYAKYFLAPLAPPAPGRLAALAQPIDPAAALPIELRSDLLNPGYFDCEAGWCVMPDGTGFIAALLPMPGLTVEMIDWWFGWYALEPIRYKLWYPPGHFSIALSERDRAQALDPHRSLAGRFQGLTHHAIENAGGPCPEKIAIEFKTPEDFGFDMSRFEPPNVGTFAGGNTAALMLAPPPGVPNFKAPAVFCHLAREIPGGVELRTRFWMGYRIINRKPARCIPAKVVIPDFVVRARAIHNAHVFANLASFLPQLFAEQGG
jgi:hypothetical protein